VIKKVLDVISLVAVAVFFAVVLWVAIRGEEPRAPGHLSIQSKLIVWDLAPAAFGFNWLIFRYAKAAAERFPRVFGIRGLLFYFGLIFVCGPLLLFWVSCIGGWLLR
jgi:hypothetical protein